MSTPYKFENRKDFVFKMTYLSLWYLYTKTQSEEVFHDILDTQAPIFRLTTLWDRDQDISISQDCAEWKTLHALLYKLYLKENNVIRFEEDGFNILKPYIEKRISEDIKMWPWIPAGYSVSRIPEKYIFGLFACEIDIIKGDYAGFHVANSCMPNSPFENVDERANDLFKMVNIIEQVSPETKKIGCSSWLNSFRPFLELFPEEYTEFTNNNLRTCSNISYTFGYWGQFVTRDGSFHEKNGQKMRDTGKFPYFSKSGMCDIIKLKEHLIKKFRIQDR